MSEKRLLIARHGETDYNRRGLLQGRGIDAPLNETGWTQAGKLAEYLGNYNAGTILSSSLQRTWQTAEPYGQKLRIDTRREKGLDEMDFGIFEGQPYAEASEELNQLKESWQAGDTTRVIPGGESPRDVFDRANDVVQPLIDSIKAEVLVLVLHGRLIRILLSEWLGYGLENMHLIEHQNGAVYQLVYNGDFNPVYLNKTDHLI